MLDPKFTMRRGAHMDRSLEGDQPIGMLKYLSHK